MSGEMCLTWQNSKVIDLTSFFLLEKLSCAVSKSSFLVVCTCFIMCLWGFEWFQKRSQLVLYITRGKCEKLFPCGSEICSSYFCFRSSFKKSELQSCWWNEGVNFTSQNFFFFNVVRYDNLFSNIYLHNFGSKMEADLDVRKLLRI